MLQQLPKTHQDALLLTAQYSTLVCMIEMLEKFLIDYLYVDKFNNNVLHKIMMRESDEEDKIAMLKLFVDNGRWHGLDLNACNTAGQSVLDLVSFHEIELAEYLESKGARRIATLATEIPAITLQFSQFQIQQQSLPAVQLTASSTTPKERKKI